MSKIAFLNSKALVFKRKQGLLSIFTDGVLLICYALTYFEVASASFLFLF